MKSVLPYILLMTGTLVAAVAIIGALYYLKPGVLGVAPKAAQSASAKDSTAVKDSSLAGVPRDTLARGQKPDSAAVTAKSPLAAARRDTTVSFADSIRALNGRIEEQQKTIAALTAKAAAPARPDSAASSKDSKSFAKMLETMPAEQAVRILKGLDDREVKAVLLGVKKRQASKILSALDPERAARMMRTLQ